MAVSTRRQNHQELHGTRVDAADREGPAVFLSAEFAGSRRRWTGRIVRVEGEIDPVTRMVHIVAQVDDPYGTGVSDGVPLAVGLFVEAEIAGRVLDDVVVLPRTALRTANTILVVDTEHRLRFRTVDVLRVTRDQVIIGGGLDAGERVCVSNLEAVTDGMKVRTAGQSDPPIAESRDDV